jgi:hypothetical protein
MFSPESSISTLADAYADAVLLPGTVRTKVVLTGSQSLALDRWGHRAFCSGAGFLNTDFLSYPEWLRYSGRENDISEQSYKDYIYGTREFYKDFPGMEEYLESCIEETIISNDKARNIVYGNRCDLVDAKDLIRVMYAVMYTLHNHTSISGFWKNNLEASTKTILKKIKKSHPEYREVTLEKLGDSFFETRRIVKALDMETLKQSFSFLIRCGLITATPVTDDLDGEILKPLKALEGSREYFTGKDDLMEKLDFTVRYPMFYIEVLKAVLGEDAAREVERDVLGSVMECHVRGLFPGGTGLEYHTEDEVTGREHEIGYIDYTRSIAVEFSVGDKADADTAFGILPPGYRRLLLTGNPDPGKGKTVRVPYYQFIHGLSAGGMDYVEGLFPSGRGTGQGQDGHGTPPEGTKAEEPHGESADVFLE